MSWLSNAWDWYSANAAMVNPIAAGIGAASLVIAALYQAHTAARRHYAQTHADWQRRITESYSKAVEQLASDKLELRLGGIYTLERISRESREDYWIVMQTLTAFIRERARWDAPNATTPSTMAEDPSRTNPLSLHDKPPTDIAAVLAVIVRRSEKSKGEMKKGHFLDLSATNLRKCDLADAHLEGASLDFANLEAADLVGTRLEGAELSHANLQEAILSAEILPSLLSTKRGKQHPAHLERANLMGANLEMAYLISVHFEDANLGGASFRNARLENAHLERTNLRNAHFEEADLSGAHLKGAILDDEHPAHFEGANLEGVTGLSDAEIAKAHGDAATILPDNLARPAHWPADPNAPTMTNA